ncbi:NAD(P)-dependent oxidoreductase [Microbacterium marmarense]|uniref:NAD(P)-dependent oxidoreductase n=1 Tax=Microbacterium marmarense TaxID=3122051 RepID=A0ABU8LQY3_9MICO
MSASSKPLLTVTGGFGRVGRMLLPRLSEDYRVHVIDRAEAEVSTAPYQITIGDLQNTDTLASALHGADALLHLAANPSPTAPWSAAIGNADITRGVLIAARDAGIEHTVVASSVHAAGGNFRFGQTPVRAYGTPRPCCEYGVGKLASEGLARLHHDITGTSVRVLRLGLTAWDPVSQDLAKTWIGDRDAASLVTGALAANPGFGIYYGVSRYAAQYWDVSNAATDLDWEPSEELPVALSLLSTETKANCALFLEPPPGERQNRA